MMVNCPYLIYEASHCAACTGWFCVVFGRKKKLTDISMCKVNAEWLDCTRYTTKIGTAKEPEPEEEVVELPPTEEVTTVIGADMETIKVVFEPTPTVKLTGIGVLSPPGTSRKTVKRPAAPTPPRDDCPYLGPVPVGAAGCSGFWCHAINVPLRSYRICRSPPSWHECRRFFKAARQGVKTVAGS